MLEVGLGKADSKAQAMKVEAGSAADLCGAV